MPPPVLDSRSPIVVLLDFDGTIVGDVQWLAFEHAFIHNVSIAGKPARYNPVYLSMDLKGGIIRPYFAEFITHVRRYVPQVEFFIYTASTADWAGYIIPRVEKVLGIQINRPLFTRDHCEFRDGRFVKSLEKVSPIIVKKLARLYTPVKTHGAQGIQSIILIDNTPHVLLEAEHQLLCSTYDYETPVDVFRQLPPELPMSTVVPIYMQMHPDIDWKTAMASCKPKRFLACYYRHLAKLHHCAYKTNAKARTDRFWKRLCKIMITLNLSHITAANMTKALKELVNTTS